MNQELIKKALQPNNSQLSLVSNSISVYKDTLTKKCIVEVNIIIQQAFPTLEAGFFIQLNRLIAENSFTDQRLREAADYVISNCIYPQPTVAQFLKYDTRVKLYSYKEIRDMCQPGYSAFEDFKLIEDLNKYASKIDIENYGL